MHEHLKLAYSIGQRTAQVEFEKEAVDYRIVRAVEKARDAASLASKELGQALPAGVGAATLANMAAPEGDALGTLGAAVGATGGAIGGKHALRALFQPLLRKGYSPRARFAIPAILGTAALGIGGGGYGGYRAGRALQEAVED
jgi:hypothetical protein